jgi:peptide/nickel transport system substrate-binding protein
MRVDTVQPTRFWNKGRRVLAAGAAVGLCMSFLVASSAFSSGGAAAASKVGNSILTVGDGQPPVSLDPAAGTSGGDYVYLYMIYARLLDFNQTTGVITPGLATSYRFVGPGRLTFDLTLRKGATFQDGSAVNARAVAQSLQHYQQLKVQTDLSLVTKITVTGRYTLALQLSSQDSALPASLADRAGMIICPAALQKYGSTNFAAHPCGAGAYKFTSEVSGASITLTRFAKYYGGTPAYGSVQWTIYSTASAEETAARSGQLDVALQIPAADVKSLQGNANYKVRVGPSLLYTQVFFNDSMTPVSSNDVRLAFNYALNRQAILDAVDNGQGSIAWQPVPIGNPNYDKPLGATYPYNPAKAISLLASAGYPNGVSFTCDDFAGLNFETAGPVIQAEEAAVGIHITIDEMSLAQALGQGFSGVVPCVFSAWTGRPSLAITLQTLYGTTGSNNVGHVNFGLDNDISHMLTSYTTASQIKWSQKTIADSVAIAPDAPLVFAASVTLVAPSVHGFMNNFQGKDDLTIVSPAKS